LWVPTTELPVSPGHPFYAKLNTILDGAGFDRFVEEQCQRLHAPVMAWRAADPLAVRTFVGLDLDATSPDHSTISRTRRLIDVETLYRGQPTFVKELMPGPIAVRR
jgi:transposase